MLTGGATLQVPATVKVYATDAVVSQVAELTITPIVNAASVSANAVEGGFATYGTINLSIPAQAGGAIVKLTSADPYGRHCARHGDSAAGLRLLEFHGGHLAGDHGQHGRHQRHV